MVEEWCAEVKGTDTLQGLGTQSTECLLAVNQIRSGVMNRARGWIIDLEL